jgi:hypothetical protein
MLSRRNWGISAFWLGLLAADILLVSGVAVASHALRFNPDLIGSPISPARAEPDGQGQALAEGKVITIDVTCYTEGVSRLCYAR